MTCRGVIHATSTPESDIPSMHMTVGMEALWDVGTLQRWEAPFLDSSVSCGCVFGHGLTTAAGLSQAWFNLFGAGDVARHNHLVEGLFTALRRQVKSNIGFRKSLPASFYNSSKSTLSTLWLVVHLSRVFVV